MDTKTCNSNNKKEILGTSIFQVFFKTNTKKKLIQKDYKIFLKGTKVDLTN